MRSILLAWLGMTDLNAARGVPEAGLGPIARAVEARRPARLVLLSDVAQAEASLYADWLSQRTDVVVEIVPCPLSNPTDYREIYQQASTVAEEVARCHPGTCLAFHLSPGTPAMTAIWLLLAKTLYRDRGELLQSSKERGVETVDFPFDLYAELLPEILRRSDDALLRLTQGLPPETAEFTTILHRCDAMQQAVALARRLAPRDLPVLIQGEPGTGKELFARAIHSASRRGSHKLVALNCGAIPAELVDSELFGHARGAFTGAAADRRGVFEEADGGTLFLDEIGELEPPAQVRLLRALQEGAIRRLGETRERPVDVRVIAATNRDLLAEVSAGRFREDLFHRIAVGLVHLPPLRRREGDLGLLIDHLLAEINREAEGSQPGYEEKKISAGARSLLLSHSWPGNIRELRNTLARASVWAVGSVISEEDVERSLLPVVAEARDPVLERPLGNGFDVNAVLDEVRRVYVLRALEQAGGKKTEAAALLGLNSYQVLNDWLKKLGIQA